MTAPPDQSAAPHDDRSEQLRAWLTEYGPALRRYFARRAPEGDAEDLVQEVFMRLHARTSATPVDSVERYLFRTAANVLIERHRYDGVHGRRLQMPFDEDIDRPDELTPERTLIAREDYARLVAAIDNLPARTKTAFVLHRFEQMTYPAIAGRMGISLSAVKHLITRALDHLGEEMDRP